MDTKESTLIGNQDPTKIIVRIIMQGINPGEFLEHHQRELEHTGKQ